MGFFSEILGSVVKVALTPVAIVKDVVNVANGNEINATTNLLQDAVDGVVNSLDNLVEGEL